MLSDLPLFLRQFARQPKQVSAIAPSSRALGRAMAAQVGPETGRVVEFGPGTGRLTEAILARGVTPENLFLFEMSAEFVADLSHRFPGVTIFQTGAQNVADHLPADVGAVISGLPLLSMPRSVRRAIIEGAFAVLRPGGFFVQFTYGARPPLSDDTLDEMGLTTHRGPKVWGNLPPARVYTLRRKDD